jgi:hypothetical protein
VTDDDPVAAADPATPDTAVPEPAAEPGRPLVERVGLGAIAVILAGVFGFIALAAWTSGEVFLAVMAGIGALMTVWAALATLRRG